MAVAVDAKATAVTTTTSVATGTNTTLTVGASATSLLGILCTQTVGTSAPTMHWDSTGTNQPMTLLGTFTTTIGKGYFFGLVNPTVGNKTLSASWTTSSIAAIDCMSFTGSDNTSTANCFKNFNTSTLTGTTVTLVMTGATGNISVCCATENNFSFTSLTATGSSNFFTQSTVAAIAASAPSAASLTWTAVITGSCNCPMGGIDVAVPAVVALVPRQQWYQLQPILAQ